MNVDLPWNPAVLKQRIGRVHRLGQQSPVRVENFVAEESIERRILSLLDFKESMFAGALGGGEATVSLEGTRLSRFMEGVEQLTGARQPSRDTHQGESPAQPPVPATATPPQAPPTPEAAAASRPSSRTATNPWQPLTSHVFAETSGVPDCS